MQENAIHDFKKLHTAAIDARAGYEEALQDAEGGSYTSLFREMVALHRHHASELATVLVNADQRADERGSFMSVVHQTIMGVRGLFGGLDASVLPGLVEGEERNLARYDEALERSADLLAPHRALLMAQRAALAARIARMRVDEEKSKPRAPTPSSPERRP